MIEHYYYMRDYNNKPRVTVCLIEKEGEWARGVSICSFNDNPSKVTGRNIARQRAVHAWYNRKNALPVRRYELFQVLDNVKARNETWDFYKFKSFFMPPLTQLESKLIGV